MNSTISRVAGVASVVVFAGLLTFIVYTQVQSEPDVVEEQYPRRRTRWWGSTKMTSQRLHSHMAGRFRWWI